MTYDELLANVAAFAKRSDLTAVIPTFVELTTARLNRDLRVRQMIEQATLSVSGSLTALPADFLAVKSVTCGIVRLSGITQDQMELVASDQGSPELYSILGDSIQVSPVPSAATPVVLTYYKALTPLASGVSNWALAEYPDLYLYGALSEVGQYTVDEAMVARSEARFELAKRGVEKASVVVGGDRLTPSFDQIV